MNHFLPLQYVGDPIDCYANSKTINEDMLDNYCWIEGTYTKRRTGEEDADSDKGNFT